jgi:hypothetical protein
MKRLLCGALAALAIAAVPSSPEAQSWWRHVQYLANDKLQGRNAGSPGHMMAAAYVAAQFKKAGLAPCGDAGGYLQKVPLVTKRLIEPESSLSRRRRMGRFTGSCWATMRCCRRALSCRKRSRLRLSF